MIAFLHLLHVISQLLLLLVLLLRCHFVTNAVKCDVQRCIVILRLGHKNIISTEKIVFMLPYLLLPHARKCCYFCCGDWHKGSNSVVCRNFIYIICYDLSLLLLLLLLFATNYYKVIVFFLVLLLLYQHRYSANN